MTNALIPDFFDTVSLDSTSALSGCVLLPIHEKSALTGIANTIDQANNGAITSLIEQQCFTGKTGELYTLPMGTGDIEKVLLVGMGKDNDCHEPTFMKAIDGAIKSLKGRNISTLCVCLSECKVKGRALPWIIKKGVETILSAMYTLTLFKSKTEDSDGFSFSQIKLLVEDPTLYQDTLEQGVATAQGIALMRDLGHKPSNICTPEYLGHVANQMANEFGSITTRILDVEEMESLGMGALLAVGQGSEIPSRLIIMEYDGTADDQQPIVLVGKGVCFDTGGYSMKSPLSMKNMKYDMCGAASVFGTLMTLAAMHLPIKVVALLPCVFNMVDQTSYKPDDIIQSMSGKFIEITNTDAEGRLILCDALTYAQEHYNPRYLIDVATLTGAIGVALGDTFGGLFSNNEHLTQSLLSSGKTAYDRLWHMPVGEEYHDRLKSHFADMVNAATGGAGSSTAACFLEKFINADVPWAHIDIAGIAMPSDKNPILSGRPVPMLVEFILKQCQH